MALGGDPALATEGWAIGSAVGQVRWGPNVVQVISTNHGFGGENRSPGTVLVIRQIDRIGGCLSAGDFVCALEFAADHIARGGEIPGVDDVADQLAFVGVAHAGVNLDAAILIAHGAIASEVRIEDLPPEGIVAARERAVVFVRIHNHGETHLLEVIEAACFSGLFLCFAEGGKKHARQDGDDGNDDE